MPKRIRGLTFEEFDERVDDLLSALMALMVEKNIESEVGAGPLAYCLGGCIGLTSEENAGFLQDVIVGCMMQGFTNARQMGTKRTRRKSMRKDSVLKAVEDLLRDVDAR